MDLYGLLNSASIFSTTTKIYHFLRISTEPKGSNTADGVDDAAGDE